MIHDAAIFIVGAVAGVVFVYVAVLLICWKGLE